MRNKKKTSKTGKKKCKEKQLSNRSHKTADLKKKKH